MSETTDLYRIISFHPDEPGIEIHAEVYGSREANEMLKVYRTNNYGDLRTYMRKLIT